MADANLQLRVTAVQGGPKLSGPPQVGAGRQDAEAATQPRHAGCIGPVRRLAGVPDDPEHIVGREIEDRQPVEDLATGNAHAVVSLPGNLPGPCRALVGAHAHCVHDASAEPGIGLEIAAQLAFDGAGLEIRRTPPDRVRGPHAALFNAFEQGLAGSDGRQDQRYALGESRLDMLDRAGPLDLAKGRVNRHELIPRDDAREQDRHGLRILASRGRDRHQRAPPDHLPAFGRYGNFEDGIPGSAGARVHARRPSWSVRTMSSVIETKSGEMTYSGSLPSSLGGQTVTAAIAATGRPERKQLKRQKFPASPPVRASNARRWSSVMLVVMAAVSRAVAQEDRSPALGFGRTTPDPTS